MTGPAGDVGLRPERRWRRACRVRKDAGRRGSGCVPRGHLDAVLRMLEDDRYCIDILHQLSAVEGAITRARRDILEGHLRGCVADAVGAGEIEPGDVADEALAAVFGVGPPATRTEHRTVP
jgi:CsoR family transcriptional regulator, copper-sensing transcriptional repressor